jgi:hypothetical protein
MSALDPYLIESYYVSSFISGLKDDIKLMLKILKPAKVLMAFELARWQEESNNALARKTRSLQRINIPINSDRVTSNVPPNFNDPSKTERVKPLLDGLYEQRKRLGQCFKYNDKYMPGHKCSANSLHVIKGIEGEKDEGIRELEGMM